MFKALLYLGLLVTPFVFIPGLDVRDVKMPCAVFFSTILIAAGFYFQDVKRLDNKWLWALLAYIPVSIYFAPIPEIWLNGIDVTYFWCWEPYLQITLFALTVVVIAGYEFTHKDVNVLFNLFFYCGLATAGYMVLQYFGHDQFFKPVDAFIDGKGHVSGFIGNPTHAAPFVAMTLPFAILLRRWVAVPVFVTAIFMSNSQMAYGSMFVSMLFYMGTRGPRRLYAAAIILIMGLVALGVNTAYAPPGKRFLQDNERIHHWTQILKDVRNPLTKDAEQAYPFTGRGLGSFKYVYHIEHPGGKNTPNRFHQAHNEYLEFLYSTGAVGLFLLVMAIYATIKRRLRIRDIFDGMIDEKDAALMAGFLCIVLNAGGTFVFQIGTTAFYTVVFAGLLHNDTI